jgi:hypothetical protein
MDTSRSGEICRVRSRPLAAWLIYAGLTIPIGLFGHALFELVGGVARRSGGVEIDHAMLAACGAAMFAFAALTLRRGSDAQRRRRLALVRAALPSGPRLLALGAGLQVCAAAATLMAEGVAIDPARLALAAAVAFTGVLLGALVFHALEDDVLAIVAALIVPASDDPRHTMRSIAAEALPRCISRALRLLAGRAPPFASVSHSL